MLKIVLKIGDEEYDTGSLITNLPEDADDWAIVYDMVEDWLASQAPPDEDEDESEGS